MKGIVFNLLEKSVSAEHGEDAWDEVLEMAGLDGAYTSLGGYPDSQFYALRHALSQRLGLAERDVERWFGRVSIAHLAELYPELFAAYRSARELVLALNEIIHPEVRKLYPGADVPVFEYDQVSASGFVLRYHSARRMCAFAEGLIQGAAAHFEEQVDISQPTCMHDGHAVCTIECFWSEAGSNE